MLRHSFLEGIIFPTFIKITKFAWDVVEKCHWEVGSSRIWSEMPGI